VTLSTRFFPAFLVTLDNFAERDFFASAAPDHCSDGHDYYWEPGAVRKALIGQMGPVDWPLDPNNLESVPDDRVVEYVEAFFQLVQRPTDSWFHQFCGSSHPTSFDRAGGRYDYTVSVNALLSHFETGLRLQNGKIRSSGSPILGPRLAETLPFGSDDHLRNLVTMALTDFVSANPQKRWNALRHIADAYERIKSSQVPGNKRRSVAALVGMLRPEEGLASHLDALLREMTTLSNDLTIRHHEVGTVEITQDAELIDFLFYSYYNLIRFALLRLYSADE
jgi:hypothetical protein